MKDMEDRGNAVYTVNQVTMDSSTAYAEHMLLPPRLVRLVISKLWNNYHGIMESFRLETPLRSRSPTVNVTLTSPLKVSFRHGWIWTRHIKCRSIQIRCYWIRILKEIVHEIVYLGKKCTIKLYSCTTESFQLCCGSGSGLWKASS